MALALTAPAGARTVLPDRNDINVLASVTIIVPAGAIPRHSPNWVALKLIRQRSVAGAALTALSYCQDFVGPCSRYQYGASLRSVWVARFTGVITDCPLYRPPGSLPCPWQAPAAEILVLDDRLRTFGFNIP